MQIRTAMKSALSYAKHGIGISGKNPSVGCVILNSDMDLVSLGRTGFNGRPHAEKIALESLKSDINGGIAVITLEPCAHENKNGSCASLLAKSGIKKIYVSCLDPDRRTNGKGIDILRKAGIEVSLGMCESEAKNLNQGFFSRILRSRPYISLKMATSLDSKIATPEGKSKWITGTLAREHGHMQRAKSDAILIGINTLIKDDPLLTCRIRGLEKHSPDRIVVDSSLSIPINSNLIKTLKLYPLQVWTSKKSDKSKKKKLINLGVSVLELDDSSDRKLKLKDGLKDLASRGINNLLVEGGGKVSATLLSNNLVDRIFLYRSGKILGDTSISSVSGLDLNKISLNEKFQRIDARQLDDDVFEEWRTLN